MQLISCTAVSFFGTFVLSLATSKTATLQGRWHPQPDYCGTGDLAGVAFPGQTNDLLHVTPPTVAALYQKDKKY
jgi:hypothetical protein